MVIQVAGPPATLLKRAVFLENIVFFFKVRFETITSAKSQLEKRNNSHYIDIYFITISSWHSWNQMKHSKMYNPTCTDTCDEFIYFDFCCSLEACQTFLPESPLNSAMPIGSSVSQYWLISFFYFLHEVEFQ